MKNLCFGNLSEYSDDSYNLISDPSLYELVSVIPVSYYSVLYVFIASCPQVFGSKVRVDAVSKVAELELAEKEKMKDKVEKILKHSCNVFINRFAALFITNH